MGNVNVRFCQDLGGKWGWEQCHGWPDSDMKKQFKDKPKMKKWRQEQTEVKRSEGAKGQEVEYNAGQKQNHQIPTSEVWAFWHVCKIIIPKKEEINNETHSVHECLQLAQRIDVLEFFDSGSPLIAHVCGEVPNGTSSPPHAHTLCLSRHRNSCNSRCVGLPF